ncbi:D-alanyl-D-alanine carboxypeptidase/D-alanyl-D-alanine-endopeptidase [Psychrobacter sp. DAB_AL32B]|uniref:D-alanyl-D-alanine carboxypeptidase/D-alanyl-D-alanine-endopeptidase n=1 Tax=Psychrobacter sp. DAB_AL32B TaxID=1028414 RepID=UPI000B7FBCC0|nr:D-alanyl-D-alanine carboxypeptidase [Psychrobacter sp. DAB_AL32B]OXL23399.1 D-alanyl-D-alanine carboxypeptidase [Psychrobacter sp. DAB_AL32B]
MLPTFKLIKHPTNHAKLTANSQHLKPSNHITKRLSILILFATPIVAPIHVQAALPEAIETALARADLTAADISIVITPVGDKNASRLPSPIKVINSGDIDSTKTDNNNKIDNQSKPASTDNANTDSHSINKQATQNNNANKQVVNHQSPLVTIEKRTITQYEKQLNAYTDDPYTYQSLESSPSLLPDGASTPANHRANHNNRNDNRNESNSNSNSSNKNKQVITNTSIKISFSPLLNHQPDIARTPASTMKLVPSFIALDTLGADFVWHTRVYHTGIIIGDQLYGDLIIQGSGDPKMTHERLQQLLYKVQTSGIRHINGDIIIDSTIFKNVSKDPAAFDNAPLRPYNASPDGFLVNFSSIAIQSYPLSNTQAQLTYTPQLANYQLPNMINIRAAACGQARYSLAPQWQPTQLTLNASLPDSCGEHAFYVAYPDAKDFAARVIAAKWQALGNTLSGKVISQETPYDVNKKPKSLRGLAAIPMSPLPIVSYPSLNLTQQIYDINHFSNNVMTEQVALSIAAYKKSSSDETVNAAINETINKTGNKTIDKLQTSLYQFSKPTTTSYPAALQTINQWWQTHLTTPPPHLTNGSGLCRDCTISAANLSELLTYAYNHPSFDAYVSSLGIAGVSGTITAHSERLPESQAIGRSWIKTGTLNNVTSMAGYVKGLSGQDYVVVGLINSEQALNAYTARPVLDAMLDWTAQH